MISPMEWEMPPIIKAYEALGAIADKRVHISGNEARIYSSSGNKYYAVSYNPIKNAIVSNDNGSYWVGYLGYPSIAFLLLSGVVQYDSRLPGLLKGIKWKDINTRYNNDFEKTEEFLRQGVLKESDVDFQWLDGELEKIMQNIKKLRLIKLESDPRPPIGY